MRRFKIIYSSIGLILVVLLIFAGSSGLSNKNTELYKKACDMQESIEKNVWAGVNIKNHPIAIRKGDTEYVFYQNNIEKREAVIPVYACSVYEVNNSINILMPSYEEMNKLGDIIEGISDGTSLLKSQFGFSKNSISEKQYISILYHEALHVYQLENFEEQISKMYEFNSNYYGDKVIEKIDSNEEIKNLYKREGEILYKAIVEKDNTKTRHIIKQYINMRNKRIEAIRNMLNEKDLETLMFAEKYFELVEGTARYVEVKTLEMQKENEVYKKYLSGLKEFSSKREKYYRSGMAMGFILDRFNNGWKSDVFSQDKSVYELLCEYIKISN